MPIVHLTQSWVDKHLYCPEGKRRIEYVDADKSQFFIEVRATSPGTGTYYQRFQCPVTARTKTIKISSTSDMDLATAKKKAKSIRAEIALGNDPHKEKQDQKSIPTFSDFYENSFLPVKEKTLRSARNLRSMYEIRLKKHFGDYRLDLITREMIIKFHNSLKYDEKLSGAHADHHLKAIKGMFTYAYQLGVIPTNVSQGISNFNDYNQVDNTLNQEQLERLLAVLTSSDSPIAKIALVLMATGCRVGEILSATWENCNLEDKTLYIPSHSAKNKKGRFVPLNEQAIKIIVDLTTRDKFDYLFINPRTKKPYVNINKKWRQIREEAGLPWLRAHDLRHFVGSTLASNNISIYLISKLLGHQQVSTSERYSKVNSQALRSSSDKVSEVISNAMNGT